MVRAVAGVIVGGIVWWMGFWGVAIAVASFWPAYGVAGRELMTGGAGTFTTTMYAFNVLLWVLAEIAAGWIAVVVGRRRESAWLLAAPLMVFLCFMHLYLEWARFPGWYNLAVALLSGPAVLWGGRLAARFVRPAAVIAPAAARGV
jgi:hypothetical protein